MACQGLKNGDDPSPWRGSPFHGSEGPAAARGDSSGGHRRIHPANRTGPPRQPLGSLPATEAELASATMLVRAASGRRRCAQEVRSAVTKSSTCLWVRRTPTLRHGQADSVPSGTAPVGEQAWWPAVEAAITTGYSNARSEGYNRLAKHQGQRLRLPQRREPAPTHTVGLHSSTPTSHSGDQRDARPSSMSRFGSEYRRVRSTTSRTRPG